MAGQLADERSDPSDPEFDVDAVGPDINSFDEQLDNASLLGREEFVPKGGERLQCAADLDLGYTVLRPATYETFALLRSNLKSHSAADVTKSVAYGKRIKIYPLSQAANPPATAFTDVADVPFDSTIRYDGSFYESLNRIVQSEPWLSRDRAMIDVLRSLGIEKGKPFNPDAKTKAALETEIREAQAWLEARYDAGFPPFYDGGRWMFPANPEMMEAVKVEFADADRYPVDARGLTYSYATLV